MKREILRCMHFRQESENGSAYDISFQLFQGEILGLIGLDEYESNKLLTFLSGGAGKTANSSVLTLNDKRFRPDSPSRVIAEHIFCIRKNGADFSNLSIEENILYFPGKLSHARWTFRTHLPESIRGYVKQYIGTSEKNMLGSLNMAQRCMINLIKAVYLDVKIVIVEMDWESFNDKDKGILKSLISDMRSNGISFLMILQNDDECAYCDRYNVFNNGMSVWTFDKNEFSRDDLLKCFDPCEETELRTVYTDMQQQQEIVLQIVNMKIPGNPDCYSLGAGRGECVGIIDHEHYHFLELADAILGTIPHVEDAFLIHGKKRVFESSEEAWKNGIYYFSSPTEELYSFSNLSEKENTLFPWLKSSSRHFGFLRKRFLENEYNGLMKKYPDAGVKNADTGRKQVDVMMRQLRLVYAQIIVAVNPTRGLNYQNAEYILGQIQELAREGKTVLLFTNNMHDIDRCCSRYYTVHSRHLVEKIRSWKQEDR